ncbi:Hed1p SKDI_04G2470 [Saccharomyces kudriavzevii IFO 1802]|uniref:HED1-like protein n=1 Tax=Saccharomyces kudriavzevii (strain ATCC MYA-4449 / AS 2.2408 / CBS 8840 / NBRC 1802 / NCYC 2889) TaxID=226230 RepID=A0AA35JEZ0_SACK1|nr:uncharacterized protein SKDI_04G2470 [Saccharomyces kudriavzevii IFO 1802]CAI4057869.1 hypothetical protein SKDI_04G2470 [Saccharomyces kudriavzevii IFO 1802]
MQHRSNRRSCTTVVTPLREYTGAEKPPYTETGPSRRNRRSTTTSSVVNINVVERKLFNLELEKQHIHAKGLVKGKQIECPSAENTDLDTNKVTEEQEAPAEEPVGKQPPCLMKKSPPRKKKSLKDLIYETNKTLYQVDSNKVKYKVGLSKKQLLSPKTEDS